MKKSISVTTISLLAGAAGCRMPPVQPVDSPHIVPRDAGVIAADRPEPRDASEAPPNLAFSCSQRTENTRYVVHAPGARDVTLVPMRDEGLAWGDGRQWHSVTVMSRRADGSQHGIFEGLVGRAEGFQFRIELVAGGYLEVLHSRDGTAGPPANARFDKACNSPNFSTDVAYFDSRGGLRFGLRFSR